MTYPEFLEIWQNQDKEIAVNTSGSTGIPKSIFLSKKFMEESARRTNDFFHISSESRLYSCISPDYIGGKMMAVRSVLANCCLDWEEPSNRPLSQYSGPDGIDLLAVVPSQMEFILDNLSIMPDIRAVIIGGARIPDLLRKRIEQSGLNAYETYGMTETASHIALRKVTEAAAPFHTMPGIQVAFSPENTLQIIFDSGEFIVTNDLAELISPDEFYITGRADQIINTGGKKVNPQDIEAAIKSLLPLPFLIAGFPDDKWGERIVLVVEGSENALNISSASLLSEIKKILPGWQVPKEVFFVSGLPATGNGKIKRPKNYEDLFSSVP